MKTIVLSILTMQPVSKKDFITPALRECFFVNSQMFYYDGARQRGRKQMNKAIHEQVQDLWNCIVSMENAYSQFGKQHGLTMAQLAIVYECGCRKQVSAKQIGDWWNLSKQRVAQGVQALEKKGMLAAQRSDQDRRSVLLSLNEKGEAAYRPVIDQMIRAEASALESLGAERMQQLEGLLGLFEEKFEKELKS